VKIGVKEDKKIISGDTPEFAVESIERWWINEGILTYLNNDELLYWQILAEVTVTGLICGRLNFWKYFAININLK